MNSLTKPPPDPLTNEKARQYDIVTDIVEWILAAYRQNRSLHAIAPHLTTLGTWYDIQANLGIRTVPGEHQEDQNGSD